MKLLEIERPSGIILACKVLSKAGYSTVGYGLSGGAGITRVLYKPGEKYALKLFSNYDIAYNAFIDFCFRNPNKHLPIFKGKPLKVTDTYSAIRIEKLSRYNGDPKIIDDIRGAYSYMMVRFKEYYNNYIEVKNNFPDIFNVLNKLYNEFDKEFRNDISTQNVMMRGNTIVLVDPIC